MAPTCPTERRTAPARRAGRGFQLSVGVRRHLAYALDLKVGVNPHLLEMLNRAIPLGRAGTPDEAAGSVVMFTYPEADYVSGQVIVTGGGSEG
ncbi:SDR family oxidoreductase [Nonomuraea sp. NPDC049714]|uniref:SDR family oxidoreductase n=1 Tax=Nonomuraea sp. NPDC049714 TaxID=3364357 RepID=UPI0037A886DC